MKVSSYSKAVVSAVVALAAVIAGTFPDSTFGKWAVAVGAVAAALGLTAATKNTQVVVTGSDPGTVTIGEVVSDSGEVVGEVLADTGDVAGGVVKGTTGVVGAVLDGTVGRLLPK